MFAEIALAIAVAVVIVILWRRAASPDQNTTPVVRSPQAANCSGETIIVKSTKVARDVYHLATPSWTSAAAAEFLQQNNLTLATKEDITTAATGDKTISDLTGWSSGFNAINVGHRRDFMSATQWTPSDTTAISGMFIYADNNRDYLFCKLS